MGVIYAGRHTDNTGNVPLLKNAGSRAIAQGLPSGSSATHSVPLQVLPDAQFLPVVTRASVGVAPSRAGTRTWQTHADGADQRTVIESRPPGRT